MTDKDDARGLLREAINCMDAAISMASENGNTFLAGERIKLKARITAHLAAPAPDKSELELIHEICLNVADCPPIAESDTRTVRYVKDMAHLINRLSEPAQVTKKLNLAECATAVLDGFLGDCFPGDLPMIEAMRRQLQNLEDSLTERQLPPLPKEET